KRVLVGVTPSIQPSQTRHPWPPRAASYPTLKAFSETPMKRMFWAVFGLGMGAALGVGVTRWATRTIERLTPASVGERALEAAQLWGDRLIEGFNQGRAAMLEREAELRAQLAGPGNEGD